MENYKGIKLDKGMYRAEKGFTGMLEELDPTYAYKGTALEGLDAFERQLSRYGIKVKGSDSSTISKFFTSDAAALFPEYVSRAVAQGAGETAVIEEITASRTDINALDYRSITTDVDGTDIDDEIGEGDEIPETSILLSDNYVQLKKRGRIISASYEAIKYQRIDVFTVAMSQIGNHIAKANLRDAVKVLLDGAVEVPTAAAATVAYEDLLELWGSFEDFEMNVLLASPDMALKILSVSELRDPVLGLGFQNTGGAVTPLGAKLLKSSAVPAGTAIALDKRFALEMVTAGGIQVEYDKLINCQMERAAVTSICGFNKIFPDAVRVLKLQ